MQPLSPPVFDKIATHSNNLRFFILVVFAFAFFQLVVIFVDPFTLRACPPTCLYAPNVYAHSYARSVPCKRLVSVPPWVGPHPQRTPPPGTPPPPPKDPPPHPTPTTPISPSGRLFRVDGYSKWMVFPSAWLFRRVLLQLNTRTCSDSVHAERSSVGGVIDPQGLLETKDTRPGGSPGAPKSTPRAPIVPSVQSQRGAACKDLAQEHPESSPGARSGAHQEHPIAPRSTREAPRST